MAERAWTAWLADWFGRPARVRVGIGDDAAVVVPRGQRAPLAICCDPVVEGVHFDASAAPRAVGRKAVNRNLSDLAAMGARPDHLVASVLLPAGTSAARRRALFAGIRAAADAAGCAVVGGDLGTTPGPLTVTVTAVGTLPARALRRDGARAGDQLYVTGPLGGSQLGHHLRFAPPLREGAWLARRPEVRAAIDVSDGLLLDLHTMLLASGGLGAELDAAAIPISSAARRLARRTGTPALEHALGDGEDHVLLFAARGVLPSGGPLARAHRRPIGRVTRAPGLRLIDAAGRGRPLRPAGYQHR